MHPIERLRAVARAGPADPVAVARHAAGALLACADHPAELVVACRRLLDRQPGVGPLWWVCSVALTATEPRPALHDLLDRLEVDPLAAHVEAAIEADALVAVASVASKAGAYVSTTEAAVIDHGAGGGQPVWLLASPGVCVPDQVWNAVERRMAGGRTRGLQFVAATHIDTLVTAAGLVAPADARPGEGFPVAPELLGRSI